VRWCPDGDFLKSFGVLYFQQAAVACNTFQTCIRTKATPCVEEWQTSNLRPLRLGKEKNEDGKKEEITGQKYNGLPHSIGRP